MVKINHHQGRATDTDRDQDDYQHESFSATCASPVEFILYPQRWSVLASFACLSMSAAWMWITWSPLAVLVADLWDVDEGAVDALSGLYMCIYVPGSFLSLYLVATHLGLRRGLIVGASFNLAGAVLRYRGRNDYNSVYCGTLVAAVANTFLLATPPLISGSWFGATERGTATALGLLPNQMGVALGLGITTVVNFSLPATANTNLTNTHTLIDENKLKIYLGVQCVFATMAFILVTAFVADQPPTPPSTAAFLIRYAKTDTAKSERRIQSSRNGIHGDVPDEKTFLFAIAVRSGNNDTLSPVGPSIQSSENGIYGNVPNEKTSLFTNAVPRGNNDTSSPVGPSVLSSGKEGGNNQNIVSMNYFQSVSQMCSNSSSLLFVFSFGMSVGIYYTIPTFLSQLLPTAWSSNLTGWLGIGYQLAVISGSIGAGHFCDTTQQYRALSLALLCGAFFSLMVFAITARVAPSGSSWMSMLGFLLGVTGSGASLAALNTVGLELGTSISYPADEAAVAGILECTAELFGLLWVTVGGSLVMVAQDNFIFVLAAAVSISILLLGCSHTESKRPQ
jgi:MFS family permease